MILVGSIYEDCYSHPVLCTSVSDDGQRFEGVSLLDGTAPRVCYLLHCGVKPLDALLVQKRVQHREAILDAERQWRIHMDSDHYYRVISSVDKDTSSPPVPDMWITSTGVCQPLLF